MINWQSMEITFLQPWYFLLLLIIPYIWWVGRGSLAGLGRVRFLLAAFFRTLLMTLLVCSLAKPQFQFSDQAVTVIYLLDQSASIPQEKREAMFKFVTRDVEQHRDRSGDDAAGVIVFGRRPSVELPPTPGDFIWFPGRETSVPNFSEATNLAEAMKVALAIFPSRGARRVVIISDGNENIGSAKEIAQQFAVNGIGIDVIPVTLESGADVQVDRLLMPTTARKGEKTEARVVISYHPPDLLNADQAPATIDGTLRILRVVQGQAELVVEEPVTLNPGKNLFSFNHTLDLPAGLYGYEARFQPNDPSAERTLVNNSVSIFTNVIDKGRVLVIENPDRPDQHTYLIDQLRDADLDVDIRKDPPFIGSLADLQSYDAILLADVPRAYGNNADQLFSEFELNSLVRNTELGGGLVILGGPDSFGAGGWADTPLEEISPLNFTIKNAKVIPRGALALVLDKSGSMAGEKIDICRQAAIEAVKLLGPQDYVGVIGFDSSASWIVKMQEVRTRKPGIIKGISLLGAGGGTDVFAGMSMGYYSLLDTKLASVRHMIVVSDGVTPPADFERLTQAMADARITVSTVAVGDGADVPLMSRIAQLGKGKFYKVTSLRAIPQIFIKEVRRVARPVVYEQESGFVPDVIGSPEVLRGITRPLPPITGFVLTEPKDNPLVEIAIKSPVPVNDQTSAILATWNYGLGRVATLTTDAGIRWASNWAQSESHKPVFDQLVRWAMRPKDTSGNLDLQTEVFDGKIRITCTALDDDMRLLNFLDLECSLVTPDLSLEKLTLEQVAPGRYEKTVTASLPGNYFLSLFETSQNISAKAGVNVPFTTEVTERETNRVLLEFLATQTPAGGEPGAMISDELLLANNAVSNVNTFRRTLQSLVAPQSIWPIFLWCAAYVFLVDIFIRRVAFRFDDVRQWMQKYWPAEQANATATANANMDRLKQITNRPPQTDDQFSNNRFGIDSRSASTPSERVELDLLEDSIATTKDKWGETTKRTAGTRTEEDPERADQRLHTARLLDAKRKTQAQLKRNE